MKKIGFIAKNMAKTVLVLAFCFILCLLIHNKFENSTLIPAIFVLGAFITSILPKLGGSLHVRVDFYFLILPFYRNLFGD